MFVPFFQILPTCIRRRCFHGGLDQRKYGLCSRLAISVPLPERAHFDIWGRPAPKMKPEDIAVCSIYNPIKKDINVRIVEQYLEDIMGSLTVSVKSASDEEEGAEDTDVEPRTKRGRKRTRAQMA